MMQIVQGKSGWIEVICGPMFSGKSEELIRRLRRAKIARQVVQVFKPTIDDRYDATRIVSHSAASFEADVVTDVGDAAVIVAETGWVVPPQDSVALAGGIERAISELANAGRDALGLKCRRQIEENFSLEKMVQAYTTLWRSVLPGDKETLQVSNE